MLLYLTLLAQVRFLLQFLVFSEVLSSFRFLAPLFSVLHGSVEGREDI